MEIRFDISNEEMRPGQTIVVPIVICTTQPTKVRGVYAKFEGCETSKADYTTSKVGSNGQTQTQTHTATEREIIVNESFVLFGREKIGCFAGMADAVATLFGGGSAVTLEPGEHRYEITLAFPVDAPASMQGKKCNITYTLDVKVDLPARMDKNATHEFVVRPHAEKSVTGEPVLVRRPENEAPGFFDKMFGKRARLRLALENNIFCPGDSIHGMFQIEVDEPVRFQEISARLVGIEKTEASGHSDSHTHRLEPIVLSESNDLRSGDGYSVEFDLPITIGTIPEVPATVSANNFTVEWSVEVEVDVSWSKDPKISAPVKIFPD